MSEEEREALVTSFQCSLFDGLKILSEDIFYRTFERKQLARQATSRSGPKGRLLLVFLQPLFPL